MIITNAVIYGFLGMIIGLFRSRNTVLNSASGFNKTAFLITLIGSLTIILPFTTIIFRGLLTASSHNNLLETISIPAIFIYGILIFVSSLLIRKMKTSKIGSIISIVLGIVPICVFSISLASKTIGYYVTYYFLGELLDDGNFTIVLVILVASVLSIIGGIVGATHKKQ